MYPVVDRRHQFGHDDDDDDDTIRLFVTLVIINKRNRIFGRVEKGGNGAVNYIPY